MKTVLGFTLVAQLALICQVEIGHCTGLFPEEFGPQKPMVTHYGSLDSAAIKNLFEEFANTHNRVYLSSGEKEKRLKIFTENLKKYDEMNKLDMGSATYGIDRFSDMTVEEFKEKMLTLDAAAMFKNTGKIYDAAELENVRIPKNFDWRKKGAVSHVKNQGDCGSCWAFAAVGNLEGLYHIKHKKLKIFSEQQIVDCDTESDGCSGGWMEWAINYIKKAGGLQLNETYPYTGEEQKCSFKKSEAVLKVKENIMLPKRNEKKMAQYLFKHGPISVALDASSMFGYKGGISHPSKEDCSKSEKFVNHGITMVGFGVKLETVNNRKKKTPFWIAKNSWGDTWGDKGYYYLYRGDSSCAIDTYPSSAVIL